MAYLAAKSKRPKQLITNYGITTPKNQRKCLTNDEKQKIIEDSKKPGFCRKKSNGEVWHKSISNFCPIGKAKGRF